MPFQSFKQQRYMFRNVPKVAKRWADKYGALRKSTGVGGAVGSQATGMMSAARKIPRGAAGKTTSALKNILKRRKKRKIPKAGTPAGYRAGLGGRGIRSQGQGQGLGVGRGRGPVGMPAKRKKYPFGAHRANPLRSHIRDTQRALRR